MAATMLRQAIKEETPLILQTATEATLSTSGSSSAAIGSIAANAARSAAVASVEASATVTMGMGKVGVEVVSREVGSVIGESSILSSHLAAVKQSATHTTTLSETALPHIIPQPSITTATGTINPQTFSPIARQALSNNTASASRGSTLAQLDMNLAQSAESIKEAISNAVQEGFEEQLDKALDMRKVLVAGSGSAGGGTTAG